MTRDEKIQWMAVWAAKHKLQLVLEGECGFFRECVGVCANRSYPEYRWYDEHFERIDDNGEVWTPPDAYHKHPCVAVLGRGEDAEAQLYEWLQWFDANGFVLETGTKQLDGSASSQLFKVMTGQHLYARFVRKPAAAAPKRRRKTKAK